MRTVLRELVAAAGLLLAAAGLAGSAGSTGLADSAGSTACCLLGLRSVAIFQWESNWINEQDK